jgi:hypothetical protein
MTEVISKFEALAEVLKKISWRTSVPKNRAVEASSREEKDRS